MDTDNREEIIDKEETNYNSVATDNTEYYESRNGEEIDDDKTSSNNIRRKYESCKQTEYQTLIRQYDNTTYSLHLNEDQRETR